MMKATLKSVISVLLLAVMIFHIPFFGTTPNVGTGVEVCHDFDLEEIFED